MTKSLTFEQWYEEYRDEFVSESNLSYGMASEWIDRNEARRSFDRGLTPSKAARNDVRFMQTGEY